MAKADLTAARVRELLHYDPETGAFTWAQDVHCGHRCAQLKYSAGTAAGYVNQYGYVEIGIEGDSYRAGRLAWLHYYGEHPPTKLKHLDGNPSNAAIANLRLQGTGEQITAHRVRQVLDYNPETGIFKWTCCPSSRRLNGEVAGAVDALGYVVISIDGVRYHGHRVAWLYVHGEWPKFVIDHINGNPGDNRIANLRDVSRRVNQQNMRRAMKNNTSGALGVSRAKKEQKWKAQIGVNGTNLHLGYSDSIDGAHALYLAAKRRLHPGCTI